MIRHRHRIVLALVCSPALLAASAWAAVPSNVKQSTSSGVIDPAVRDFIRAELGRLQSRSPAAQKAAKDALISECTGHGDVVATPEYQVAYAKELNRQLLGVLAGPVLRVRLNAGIVATLVAEQDSKASGASELQDMATAMMKDKEPSIFLYGVKLAKYVIGDLAQQGKPPGNLDKQVIETVKAHPDLGYIAEEGYSALTLEPFQGIAGFGKAASMVLPDVLELMQVRTAQYATGVPASPQAEDRGTRFLAVNAFAEASAPGVRNQVLTTLGNAACAVLSQIANGNNSSELISVARSLGGALSVFGQNFNSSTLATAGQAIATVSSGTPPNTLTAACTALAAALKPMGVTITPPAGAAPGSANDTTAQPVADQSAGGK